MTSRVVAILFLILSWPGMGMNTRLQAGVNPQGSDPRLLIERLQLTSDEQAWVNEHPVIRVAGPKAFPPFQFYDADGILKGMAQDYILALSKMIGIKIEVQPDTVWSDVLKKMKNRELDVISCLAYSEERAEYIAFSKPYLSFPLVIVTRKDYEFIGGQNDLYNRRVACVRGTVACDWLTRDGISFMEYPVNTQLEALESVSLGKADAFLGNLAAITYRIEHSGLANLKIAAPTEYGNYDLHLGVRKDWPELLAIFDRALEAMNPETHIALRNRWLTLKYEHGVHLSDVIKWGGVLALAVVVVIGGFLLRNRSLSLDIEKRKSVEESLKSKTEFSNAVLRWVHSIVIVLDADGRMVIFNNAAEECSGYSHSEVKDVPYWKILVPPDEADAVKKRTDQVMAERSTTTSMNHWITKNGKKRLIQWLNSPLISPDGGTGYVLCTGRDITDQRRAEKASQENRQKLAHALEATGASIWEWNLKTNVIDIGEEIIHHLGYQKHELELTTDGMSRIVDEKSLESFANLAVRHKEDHQQTCVIEIMVKAKNGEWRRLQSRTKIYRWDRDNQPELLLGSLLDVTSSDSA